MYAANVFPSTDLLKKRTIIQILSRLRVYPNITISSASFRSPDIMENITPLLLLPPPRICWRYSQRETLFFATHPTLKAPRFLLVRLPNHLHCPLCASGRPSSVTYLTQPPLLQSLLYHEACFSRSAPK